MAHDCSQPDTDLVYSDFESDDSLRLMQCVLPNQEFTLKQQPREKIYLENITFEMKFKKTYLLEQNHDVTPHSCSFRLRFTNNVHMMTDNYGYEVICRAKVYNERNPDDPIDHAFIFGQTQMRDSQVLEYTADFLTTHKHEDLKVRHICFAIKRFYRKKPDTSHELTTDSVNVLLHQKGHYTDVTLKVEGTELRAHKFVLKMRSKKFERIFNERELNEYEIEDLDSETLKWVLFYIYTGSMPFFSRFFIKLYHAANRYEIDDLAEKCQESLHFYMNKHNVGRYSKIIEPYDVPQIREYIASLENIEV